MPICRWCHCDETLRKVADSFWKPHEYQFGGAHVRCRITWPSYVWLSSWTSDTLSDQDNDGWFKSMYQLFIDFLPQRNVKVHGQGKQETITEKFDRSVVLFYWDYFRWWRLCRYSCSITRRNRFLLFRKTFCSLCFDNLFRFRARFKISSTTALVIFLVDDDLSNDLSVCDADDDVTAVDELAVVRPLAPVNEDEYWWGNKHWRMSQMITVSPKYWNAGSLNRPFGNFLRRRSAACNWMSVVPNNTCSFHNAFWRCCSWTSHFVSLQHLIHIDCVQSTERERKRSAKNKNEQTTLHQLHWLRWTCVVS